MQPFAHRTAEGEKASTFTVVPRERRFRVDNATTLTSFVDVVEVNATALRTVRGDHWSPVRTRRPFTNTATRPLRGPATNHIAKRFPPTAKRADAPVMVVRCIDPPCAAWVLTAVHADCTSTAADTGRTGSTVAPRRSAAMAVVVALRGMPTRYRRPRRAWRQPKARTARVRIAFLPVGEFGTVHFSRSNCCPSFIFTVQAVSKLYSLDDQ